MDKREFIESYIQKLELALNDYNEYDYNIDNLCEILNEVTGVFSGEHPEIKGCLKYRNDTAVTDANIVIGILKKDLIDLPKNDTGKIDLVKEQIELLSLETEGIKNTIGGYTKDGYINNYAEKLCKVVENKDVKSISYCLLQIKNWYGENIAKIQENEYCINKNSHTAIYDKIIAFCDFFEANKNVRIIKETDYEKNLKKGPIIFLSHKSDDRLYADALEKFITGLGVKNDQLVYTSHRLHKIPLDKDIFAYLRDNINNNVYMLILWSNKYLDSPACMNELGAAWVTQSDYTNIYVPDFQFGNPKYHECAVDTHKMGAVLNGDGHCKTSMIELKDKIESIFNLSNDEKQVQYLLDTFIDDINKINNNKK